MSFASFETIFSHSVGCLRVCVCVCVCVCVWFPLLYKAIGPTSLFLVLFLLLWETDLRKHLFGGCQRMFCIEHRFSSRSFMVLSYV